MQPLRIGVIGAGENGTGHAEYFADSPRSRVVAVADPDATRGGALADRCGARWVDDFRGLLDDVDAVVVSSPNAQHRAQVIASAGAGCHVYCEKPIGLDAGDAEAMAAAVRRAGVRSTVGFSVRNNANIQTLHRLSREGAFGELISVWSRRLMFVDRPDADHWRADPKQSGGLLLEINIHELDWMMMVAGEVRSVYAQTRADDDTAHRANDHLWIMLNFAAGAVGQHEGSWRSATPNFFRGVHGTRGGAQTDEWGNGLHFAAAPGEDRSSVELDPSFDLRAHFLDCVQHDAAPVCDLEWGVKVMRVADAVFESARTGQPVTLRRTEPVVRPTDVPVPTRSLPAAAGTKSKAARV